TLWLKAGGLSGIKVFKPGDRAYIVPPYQTQPFLQPDASSTYSFSNTANIGNTFTVELSDKNGKIFARTKVTIEA
ncbi:MAG: hypothetical protein LUQ31_07540, partial [Methanoregula sp.]|nr:hypothetical protein [Methanoregula sp.]